MNTKNNPLLLSALICCIVLLSISSFGQKQTAKNDTVRSNTRAFLEKGFAKTNKALSYPSNLKTLTEQLERMVNDTRITFAEDGPYLSSSYNLSVAAAEKGGAHWNDERFQYARLGKFLRTQFPKDTFNVPKVPNPLLKPLEELLRNPGFQANWNRADTLLQQKTQHRCFMALSANEQLSQPNRNLLLLLAYREYKESPDSMLVADKANYLYFINITSLQRLKYNLLSETRHSDEQVDEYFEQLIVPFEQQMLKHDFSTIEIHLGTTPKDSKANTHKPAKP